MGLKRSNCISSLRTPHTVNRTVIVAPPCERGLERLGGGRAITVSVVGITIIRVAIVGITVVGIAVVWGWIRIVGIIRIIPPPRIAEAIEGKARTEKTPAVV